MGEFQAWTQLSPMQENRMGVENPYISNQSDISLMYPYFLDDGLTSCF